MPSHLLEILKPGTYTDMKGTPVTFSEADLRQVVESYDPAKHEAPLVLGHPKHDDPAHGWVKSLAFADGALKAEVRDVTPELKTLVDAGRYKKLSSSLYSPQAPGNPTTGKWHLRHIGFLGAFPPAVKGLAPIALAEDERGVHEFAEEDAGLWSRLRDWFIGKFGLEEADNVLPKWAVDSLNLPDADEAAQSGAMPMNYSEEDPLKTAELAEKETGLLKLESDLKTREDALRAKEHAVLLSEATAFADGLALKGQILPKDKAGIIALLIPNKATVELGEGIAPVPTSDWLKGFLQGLPKAVELGEIATGEIPNGIVEFAAPQGTVVDASRLELHQKALAYQRANPTATYEAAVAAAGRV